MLPQALLVASALSGAVASADPISMALTAKVMAPRKPAITITADEPLQNLMIALEPHPPQDGGKPSGEPGLIKLEEKRLRPGQKIVFPLGQGRIGSTHWQGIIQCQAGGKLWKREATFDTSVRLLPEISFDKNFHSEHLNLVRRYVEVRLSAPASDATIEVFADDGTKMGSGAEKFPDAAPGTWLRVPWQGGATPAAQDSVVLRLALTLHDSEGNEAKIDLYPWAVSVPHEEVKFASASNEVVDTERGKLDDSLRKINVVLDRVGRTLMQFAEKGIITNPPEPKLFVIGHTDSVGNDNENLTLSRNRARAIAAYFRSKGFRLPVYYVGYGERQLRAHTADNVDDARNRRADYTLALEAPPTIPGTSWLKL